MFDNIFPAWAMRTDLLDDIVDALAQIGYPDCNTREGQDEAAQSLGYRDADDMYDDLTDDEVDYINKHLRKRFI